MATLSMPPPPPPPLAYAQNVGNDDWNELPPAAKWKAYRKNAEKLFVPFLCDTAMHVGSFVFYAHSAKLALGENGSVFLGNLITLKRRQLAELIAKRQVGTESIKLPLVDEIDLSNIMNMPSAAEVFTTVLEFIYDGTLDLTADNVVYVTVAAFLLRIRSLFAACKQWLYEAIEDSRKQDDLVVTVERVLGSVNKLTPTEDTAEIISGITKMFQKAVQSNANKPEQPVKRRLRRASYAQAMRTVHQRHMTTTARVKPRPPGQIVSACEDKWDTTPPTKEKAKADADAIESSKDLTDLFNSAEIIVRENEVGGQNTSRIVRGRRLSYTVPLGARPGDILKVRIPVSKIASPIKNGNPPADCGPPTMTDEPQTDEAADAAVSNTKASEGATPPDVGHEADKMVDAWLYKDSDDVIFGPFDSSLMASWFREKMIPGNLLVRPVGQEDVAFQEIEKLFAGTTPFEQKRNNQSTI